MTETLRSIMDRYRSGLLSTPNIQVSEKKLSDERISFPNELMVESPLYFSTFRNSDLVNMEFTNVDFASSYFKNCQIENCIFENTSFREARFDNCVFNSCRFINCTLRRVDGEKTIFNECTFLKSGFGNAVFELCHFLKPIFKDMKGGRLGSAVLVDSKFSNSKKSIEFEGDVYFNDVFDQIDKFLID